jgi:uncharacterized repeat protein (TIGR01451 family)
MRIFAPLMLALVVSLLLAGCGGQETPVEETEEEGGLDGTSIEESTIEETNERAEATVEETTADPKPVPDPIGSVIDPQEKEGPQEEGWTNASPEEAMRDLAQTEEVISATQTVAPDPATVGSPLTFTVVVTNNSFPQHVGFKDFLPPSMTFVSATPSQGYCGPPHHGGNLFNCTLGTIPTGGSVVVEIVAIPTAPGTMTNDAQAGTGYAPVKSVSATFTVNPEPGSGIT